jgi:hydrogenase expression/formation protein HypE
MDYKNILLEHGGGGLLSHELVSGLFLPAFSNALIDKMEDGAVFEIAGKKICMTTDSYVVNPLFFPGGDIGSLAVHGTVNDLAMCGAVPLYLSAGFIIEEGFPVESLRAVIESMAEAAGKAGVKIVTGDTKVVAHGAADGLFINTSGIGLIDYNGNISVESIEAGNVIILNGSIGDHGAAVLCARENLGFEADIKSDSAPLNNLVELILKASPNIRCMRDATRGGLGAILAEIAGQSKHLMVIEEACIPVAEVVRGVCEILGFDPLFLANEGKMVVFCPENDAARVLDVMKSHPFGRNAAIIGSVSEKGNGRLMMKTIIGGTRLVDLPTGELVPRIC